MLRRLIALISATALAFAGLGSVSPASAAGTFSTPASMEYSREVTAMIPVNDQSSIMVWRSYSSGDVLKAGLMGVDGTITNEVTLDPGAQYANITMQSKNAWAVLADGTIAVTWTKSTRAGQLITSSVFVAYTSDGIEWTQAVSPFSDLVFDINNCDFYFDCGFREARIAGDSLGNIALILGADDGSTNTVQIRTSLNGVTWSSPTVYSNFPGGASLLGIAGLPSGGFVSGWGAWDGSTGTIYGIRTVGATITSWTRPAVIEANLHYINAATFVQTSPTTMGVFFADQVDNNLTTVYRKDFNFVTRSWGSKQTVQAVETSFVVSTGIIGSYRNGHVSVLITFGMFSDGTTKVYLSEIKAGVSRQNILVVTTTAQDTTPLVVSPRQDGSTYVGWAGQGVHPELATYKDGVQVNTASIPTGLGNSYGTAAVSPSGNIFFEFSAYNPTEARVGIAYLGAEQPRVSVNPTIRGTAAVGKKLTSTIPTFLSASGIGVTKFQWYSCSVAIASVRATLPADCVPISKATSSTFKVASKQKKKYLALAITNTNPVGTTMLVTKTTAKAK